MIASPELRVAPGSDGNSVSSIALPLPAEQPGSPVTPPTLVEAATGLRDFALVLAAAAYVLGYLSWALFAWSYGLGPVPALYADYVMTGLFPLVIIAAIIPMGRAIGRANAWTKGVPSLRQLQVGKALSALGTAGILLALPLRWIADDVAYGIALASLAAWLLGATISRRDGDQFLKRMVVVVVWYVTIAAALVGLVAYWDKVFAVWPQELGGPHPRCAVWDADAAQLSAETRGLLFAQPADSVGKHRTVTLYTIFAGGDFVLLKRDSTPLHRREPVYRIPKAALGADLPCEVGR